MLLNFSGRVDGVLRGKRIHTTDTNTKEVIQSYDKNKSKLTSKFIARIQTVENHDDS